MGRIAIDLPSDRLGGIEFDATPLHMDRCRVMLVATPPGPEHPCQHPHSPSTGQNDQVDRSIVHPRLGRGIQTGRVLPTVGHHQETRHIPSHGLSIDPGRDLDGIESPPLPKGRPHVRPVVDGPGPGGRQIMNDLGIQTERRHEDPDLVRASLHGHADQVDSPDLPADQGVGDHLWIGLHPEFPSEEVLVAGRAMQEGNTGAGRFGGDQPHRTIAAHHHQGIPALERAGQP